MPGQSDEDDGGRRNSWFDWLPRPSGLGDIFSFVFWGLILAFGGFLLVRSQWGQDLLRQLPSDWQLGLQRFLRGIGVDFTANITAEDYTQMINGSDDYTPEQRAALTSDLGSVLGIIREVTGSNDLESGLQNPDVILRLMRDKPDYMLGLARAFRPTPQQGSAATAAPGRQIQGMIAAFQTLIRDGRINQLLDAGHIGRTIDILQVVCPVQFNRDALLQFVQTVGMQNGQITPAFKAFLEATLTAAGQDSATAAVTVRNAFVQLLATPGMENNVAAIVALMRDARLPDGSRPPIYDLLSNEQNARATITLIRTLEQQGAGTAVNVLNQLSNGENIDTLLRTPGVLAALLAWRDSTNRDALPPAMQQLYDRLQGLSPEVVRSAEPIMDTTPVQIVTAARTQPNLTMEQYYMEVAQGRQPNITQLSTQDRLFLVLISPELRTQITSDRNRFGAVGDTLAAALRANQIADPDARMAAEFLTTPTRGTDGSQRYGNLEAFSRFFRSLDDNPANASPEARDRTNRVAYAIYRMIVMNDTTLFRNTPPEDIAAFFRDNKDAMGALLRDLDYSRLPPEYRQFLERLHDGWDGQLSQSWVAGDERTHGYSEVFSNANVVAYIQRLMGRNGEGDLVDDIWTWAWEPVLWDNEQRLKNLESDITAIQRARQARAAASPGPATAVEPDDVAPAAAPYTGGSRPGAEPAAAI